MESRSCENSQDLLNFIEDTIYKSATRASQILKNSNHTIFSMFQSCEIFFHAKFFEKNFYISFSEIQNNSSHYHFQQLT